MKVAIVRTMLLLLLMIPGVVAAAGETLDNLDAAALAHLEDKALHASPREQSYLYTELVHVYSQLAGRQLAAGDTNQAQATLKRIQFYIVRVQSGLTSKAKKLKSAEMLLESASFRMNQLAHRVSTEDQPSVQATLKEINKVHDEMLTQVFAH